MASTGRLGTAARAYAKLRGPASSEDYDGRLIRTVELWCAGGCTWEARSYGHPGADAPTLEAAIRSLEREGWRHQPDEGGWRCPACASAATLQDTGAERLAERDRRAVAETLATRAASDAREEAEPRPIGAPHPRGGFTLGRVQPKRTALGRALWEYARDHQITSRYMLAMRLGIHDTQAMRYMWPLYPSPSAAAAPRPKAPTDASLERLAAGLGISPERMTEIARETREQLGLGADWRGGRPRLGSPRHHQREDAST